MTDEELARFDEASNHPYECQCALCREWWFHMPPEDISMPGDMPQIGDGLPLRDVTPRRVPNARQHKRRMDRSGR